MPSKGSGLLVATAAITLLAATPALAQLSPSQGGPRVILSFGNDQFIPKAAIEATTGARFQSDFTGLRFLDEVSVIVLADIGFAQLPAFLQSNLVRWVELGGSLLVTGGNGAFFSGGYAGSPLAPILPLRPIESDRTSHGFSPTYILNQNHPLFTGVTTTTMANFNETTIVQDASPLLEYRGVSKGGASGAGITGSGRPFTTATTRVAPRGGTSVDGSGAGSQNVVVLGQPILSGQAGTPGVGGQGNVSVPLAPPGGPPPAPGVTIGTNVTPGAGGQGGAVGLPVPTSGPGSSPGGPGQPAFPTATNTPGVLANPVTPILPVGPGVGVDGGLSAGGLAPATAVSTASPLPGQPGLVPVAVAPVVTCPTCTPANQFNPDFSSEGGIQGGGRAAMPLIAERRQGKGLIMAIALDMNATGQWQDRDNLTVNAIRYLLDQSKLPLIRR